jgi:hypothetical protein
MKTIRIIFSIALVALALNTFGNNYNSNEVAIENELVLENWMISPFEAISVESDLVLENWMTEAFNTVSPENDLFLECWMKVPFEVSDIQDTELWMAAAWN